MKHLSLLNPLTCNKSHIFHTNTGRSGIANKGVHFVITKITMKLEELSQKVTRSFSY